MGGPEPLVHRAVALPQQEGGPLERRVVETAPSQPGVPHRHVVGAVAEVEPGVPAEVLVGEEQHLMAAGPASPQRSEGPGEDGPGVRRGAHHAPVAAHERLQGGRRVHVGHRDHAVEVGRLGEGLPGLLDRVDVRHVGHRAAGVEVRQHDLLVGSGEDVRRFGHEVDSAEHDVIGLGLAGGDPGQPEGVAPGVGPPHDLVALVVVPEDDRAAAELGLGLSDPVGELVRAGAGVAVG